MMVVKPKVKEVALSFDQVVDKLSNSHKGSGYNLSTDMVVKIPGMERAIGEIGEMTYPIRTHGLLEIGLGILNEDGAWVKRYNKPTEESEGYYSEAMFVAKWGGESELILNNAQVIPDEIIRGYTSAHKQRFKGISELQSDG